MGRRREEQGDDDARERHVPRTPREKTLEDYVMRAHSMAMLGYPSQVASVPASFQTAYTQAYDETFQRRSFLGRGRHTI